MKVETHQQGLAAVLAPRGPLVRDDMGELKEALEAASASKPARVVIDMADVPYLDSVGIEFLLQLQSGSGGGGARPKLARLSPTCREALDLTDVLSRLETFENVEHAVRSYGR